MGDLAIFDNIGRDSGHASQNRETAYLSGRTDRYGKHIKLYDCMIHTIPVFA